MSDEFDAKLQALLGGTEDPAAAEAVQLQPIEDELNTTQITTADEAFRVISADEEQDSGFLRNFFGGIVEGAVEEVAQTFSLEGRRPDLGISDDATLTGGIGQGLGQAAGQTGIISGATLAGGAVGGPPGALIGFAGSGLLTLVQGVRAELTSVEDEVRARSPFSGEDLEAQVSRARTNALAPVLTGEFLDTALSVATAGAARALPSTVSAVTHKAYAKEGLTTISRLGRLRNIARAGLIEGAGEAIQEAGASAAVETGLDETKSLLPEIGEQLFTKETARAAIIGGIVGATVRGTGEVAGELTFTNEERALLDRLQVNKEFQQRVSEDSGLETLETLSDPENADPLDFQAANIAARVNGEIEKVRQAAAGTTQGVVSTEDMSKESLDAALFGESNELKTAKSRYGFATLITKVKDNLVTRVREREILREEFRRRDNLIPKRVLQTEEEQQLQLSEDLDITVEDNIDLANKEAMLSLAEQIDMRPTTKNRGAVGLLSRWSKNPNRFQLTAGDWFKKKFADRFAPVIAGVNFARFAKGVDQVLPESDPELLLRAFFGANGAIDTIQTHGMINDKGEFVLPGGLKWLTEQFDGLTREEADRLMLKTVTYGVAKRIREKAAVAAGIDLRALLTKIDNQDSLTSKEQSFVDSLQTNRKRAAFDLQERRERRARERQGIFEGGETIVQRLNREAAERATQEAGARPEPLTGVATDPGIEIGIADLTINSIESDAQFGRIAESLERYQQWANANLEFAAQKGFITVDTLQRIQASNNEYIAMQRIYEEIMSTEDPNVQPNFDTVLSDLTDDSPTGLAVAARLIRELTGSPGKVVNPYASLLETTSKLVKEGFRNDFKVAFTDLVTPSNVQLQQQITAAAEGITRTDEDVAGTFLEGAEEAPPTAADVREASELASVGRRVPAQNDNTITVLRDGQREFWEFQPDIAKSLQNMELAADNMFMKVASFLPKVLRNTVTYTPGFAIRNRMRDMMTRMVISRSGGGLWGADLASTSFKNLMDIRNKRDPMEFAQLAVKGGAFSGFYMRDKVDWVRAIDVAINQDPKFSENSIVLWPQLIGEKFSRSGYAKWVESQEVATRLDEYQDALNFAREKLGYDEKNAQLYAMGQSRNLIDFAVAGDFVRELNKIMPFTNAAVQGTIRTYQAMAEEGGKNLPAFMARWSLYVLAPVMAERIFNGLSGNDEEYQQLPAYQKDLFYNFKIARNKWLRVPKPFELGVAASGVGRAFDSMTGEPDAFEGVGGQIAQALLPVDEQVLFGPFGTIAQAIANRDIFRDRYIVPFYDSEVDLSLRDPRSASGFGKAWQAVFEILTEPADPKDRRGPLTAAGRKIGDARTGDFLISGVFGNLGTIVKGVSRGDVFSDPSRFVAGDLLGIVKNSNVRGGKDIEFVLNFAERRRVGPRNKVLKPLKTLVYDYYHAETDADKDRISKEVREEAKKLREQIERRGDLVFGEERARGGTKKESKTVVPF